jgi:hypothetical protein
MVGGLYFVYGMAKTDNYQTLATIVTNMQLIHAGNIPFGTFWLPNYYGGAPATFLAVSFMPNVGGTLLLLTSLVTNNVFWSFKFLVFGLLLLSQFLSYKFAKFHFHNTAIAWIFSIAYSFSTFFFTHINNGVIDFIAAATLIPFTLLMCERLFASPNRKNMSFAVASLVLLFFCDLQLTIFTIYFIALRTLYHFVTSHNKEKNITLLKRLAEGITLFALSAAPFIISFSFIQDVGALAVPTIPYYYLISPSLFFKGIADITLHETASYYVGLIILALAFLPMLFYKRLNKSNNQNFLFYLLIVVFFFLIAIGTPLSTLVTSLFVRVPSRVQILISLSLSLCAGYGLLTLNELLRQKLPKTHLVNKSKVLRIGLAVFLAIIILVDLTSGISIVPVNNAIPKFTGGDNYIKNQQGDFRVLEFPSVWGYTDYESQILQHEIIGIGIIALRAYPPSSQIFADLSNEFQYIKTNSTAIDPGNFTVLATICATKYVLIQTNYTEAKDFTNFFNNVTQYYTEVYNDSDSIVYENRYFEGTAFALKDNGTTLNLGNLTINEFGNLTLPQAKVSCTKSFNRLDVSANVSEPAHIVLSQSYYPYWTVNNSSNTPAFKEFLGVSAFDIGNGTTNETAVFFVANQTWNLYVGFLVPLVLLGIVIYARAKSKKNLFIMASATLLFVGIVLASLGVLGTSMAPASLRGVVELGIFNRVLLELGCAIILGSLLVLANRKLFGFGQNFWQNIRKRLPKGSANKDKRGLLLENMKTKLAIHEKLADNLIKLALISFLIIVIFAKVQLSGDITDWLNYSSIGVLSIVALLFAVRVLFMDNQNGTLTRPSANMLQSSNDSNEKKINRLHLGIFAGLIGICLSGLLMRQLALFSHTVYFSAFVLCGALGGLCFGALTSGNNKLRGIIGCGFGAVAIMFGLLMTYSTPIIIGYMIPTATQVVTPIYQWHQYSFIQFAVIQLVSVNGLFYMFFGLVGAYVGGSCLSLRTKPKQMK